MQRKENVYLITISMYCLSRKKIIKVNVGCVLCKSNRTKKQKIQNDWPVTFFLFFLFWTPPDLRQIRQISARSPPNLRHISAGSAIKFDHTQKLWLAKILNFNPFSFSSFSCSSARRLKFLNFVLCKQVKKVLVISF